MLQQSSGWSDWLRDQRQCTKLAVTIVGLIQQWAVCAVPLPAISALMSSTVMSVLISHIVTYSLLQLLDSEFIILFFYITQDISIILWALSCWLCVLSRDSPDNREEICLPTAGHRCYCTCLSWTAYFGIFITHIRIDKPSLAVCASEKKRAPKLHSSNRRETKGFQINNVPNNAVCYINCDKASIEWQSLVEM